MFGSKGRIPYVVGIEFGPSTLKVVGVKAGSPGSVGFCVVANMPEVRDDDHLVKAIQAALKGRKLPTKAACLNFSDESLTIRRISMPATPPDEIADALIWQAADKVQFEMETATAGFKQVGASRGEKGAPDTIEILFAATPRALIEKQLKIVKAAGLDPIAVSIAPSGIESILKYDDEAPSTGTVMAVDFRRSHTDISFYKDKGLEFVRTIRTGSGSITDAISAGISISPEDAEKIKTLLGIAYERTKLEGGIDSIRVLSAERPLIEALSKEIKRSMDYYAQEYGGGAVSCVYLAGGGSLLKNLDRYLSEELSLPVKRLHLPKSIDASRAGIKEGEELPVISLIGTAIGYPGQMDLLPREFKVEKTAAIGKALSIAGFIIVAVVLAVSSVVLRAGARDSAMKLQKLKSERASLEPVRELSERAAEKTALMTQTRKSELPLGCIMKELSNVTPPGMVFSNLRINPKTKSLDISGVVNQKVDAAQKTLSEFMGRLEKSKYFKEAQMGPLTGGTPGSQGPQDKQDKGPVMPRSNFSISCLLE